MSKDSLFGTFMMRIEKLIYNKSLFVTGNIQGICDLVANKTKIVLIRNGFDSNIFKPT